MFDPDRIILPALQVPERLDVPGESQAHPRLHALCRFVARPGRELL
jgi:hypothetical protein